MAKHVYKHFQRFVNGKCTFEEVDVDLCRKFMEYLLDAPQSIHTNQKAAHQLRREAIGQLSVPCLHTAYRDRKIKENPNGFLDRIECIPTIREHLSQEELIRLAETPCEEEVLKKAFLFACLTGLRKSDIRQLTWQRDTTIHQRQDVRYHPYAENQRNSA
ncbi:site-specific integrase [Phocaeicola vulgatus]|nr:site-specific integrase [Phocaeicola vulgatus]